MMQDDPPRNGQANLRRKAKAVGAEKRNECFKMACRLQERIFEQAQTAKGQVLSALCRAFDTLENRKDILRGRPSPDALLRFAKYVPKQTRGALKRQDTGPRVKAGEFPEPREPETGPTPTTTGASQPGTGDETGQGISFAEYGADEGEGGGDETERE